MKKGSNKESKSKAARSEEQPVVEDNVQPSFEFIFKKKNYLWMIIGLVVIALGFALMAGGGSEDPAVFNEAIFSWRRIRLAPMLVLAGFGIEMYAILLNPDKK
ncbi:DUF3098 domain-containing protein [Nonlabens sp. Ci31]|jgi:hypothetical protein|uniref:DUF3098 domain-containing protein n=1 Tax=Nonlabens sp. Ci31 TaxID=2608253 RepID=UPI00146424E0|nr:DUF3098 domain-containing protein [Nonlabens sp. Ci31]QJP33675.1 DUF3098 domain-containing protein [Nonlabens sp. Ci31]